MVDYTRYEVVNLDSVDRNGKTGSNSWSYAAEHYIKSGPVATQPENGKFVYPTTYRASHLFAWPIKSVWTNDQTGVKYTGAVPHTFWYAADTGICYGCYNTWPNVPAIPSWCSLKLKHRLHEKAVNQEFNMAQSLGEAPETVRHILNTGARVLALYRAVRTGNVSSLKRLFPKGLSGNLAGGWLEWQYAWKPLLADMYAATKVISEGLKQPITTVKATVYDDDFGKPPVINYVHAEGRFRRGVSGSVTFKVNNYLLYDLNALGLLNPLALAWELLPLSFVVDWLLHIGTFLESLSVPIALKFEHGYETSWVNNSWLAREMHPVTSGDRPKWAFRQKAMARVKYGSYPYPLPYFRMNLNLNQVISFMALAWQAKRLN